MRCADIHVGHEYSGKNDWKRIPVKMNGDYRDNRVFYYDTEFGYEGSCYLGNFASWAKKEVRVLTKQEFDQLPQPGHVLESIMKLALVNTVRLPSDLYNKLVMRAELKNMSVDQYVEELLKKE